jgi:hypothetical protein
MQVGKQLNANVCELYSGVISIIYINMDYEKKL